MERDCPANIDDEGKERKERLSQTKKRKSSAEKMVKNQKVD